ncbi:MAG: Sigma-G inhibitor, Gin [Paenibacillaceae bacterium]|jgi:hypothetical protein|nr:Sigma-G inhibitor, Gin [Paenibacillaceae bacterium]
MEDFEKQDLMRVTEPAEELGQGQSAGAAEICIICGSTGKAGIRVISEFICEDCEMEIVRTDVQDAKYPYFIHQLKQIWYPKNA